MGYRSASLPSTVSGGNVWKHPCPMPVAQWSGGNYCSLSRFLQPAAKLPLKFFKRALRDNSPIYQITSRRVRATRNDAVCEHRTDAIYRHELIPA
jgi:hypothetical protein